MEPETKQPQPLKSYFTEDKECYTFYFDLSLEGPPEKVETHLEARTVMEEALLLAIELANSQLLPRHLRLHNDLALYKPRLAGKNFKPKTDMPALSLRQKICDLKVIEIAVQLLNRDKAVLPIEQPPVKYKTELKEGETAANNLGKGEGEEESQELSSGVAQMQVGGGQQVGQSSNG